MELTKLIGITIVKLRKEKGLSQEDLAFSCGIARSYFGAIERGEKRISVVYLQKITEKLDIELSKFFEIIEHGKTNKNNQ